MSKYCPILKRKVVYLECLECKDKICKRHSDSAAKSSVILKTSEKDIKKNKTD